MPGFTKKLGDGDTLALHVPPDPYTQSVHAPLGCTTCHSEVKVGAHPPAAPIASKREFAIARAEVCRACHNKQAGEWDNSVHAALSREGNAGAPLCTGCHSPHAVKKGAAAALDTVPCKSCHNDIFNAYASSMHGKAQAAAQGQAQASGAPLCFGCHGAHGVKVPTAGVGLKPTCLTCHPAALPAHQAWLPNAELHFNVVSCPACHAPTAKRKVDLVLFDSATQEQIPEPEGVPEFQRKAGAAIAAGSGTDGGTLLRLLETLNHPGATSKTGLRGRLTVQSGVEAHQLTSKSQAISDCKTCHQAGSEAFQSVTVSVAGPGGVPKSYGVSQEVLKSAVSIESMGGFYAIGGTRITILDMLLLFVVFVGVGFPVVHATGRWVSKRLLNGHTHH